MRTSCLQYGCPMARQRAVCAVGGRLAGGDGDITVDCADAASAAAARTRQAPPSVVTCATADLNAYRRSLS